MNRAASEMQRQSPRSEARRVFVCAVALCAGLAACSDDETKGGHTPGEGQRFSIEVQAPVSRAQLTPDGDLVWSPGDRIGVYIKSGDQFTTRNAPLTYTGQQAAASGLFSGDVEMTKGAAEYTLYAYYPYSEEASDDPSRVAFELDMEQHQTASGNSSEVGEYAFLVAGAVSSITETFPPIRFRHAFSLVGVELTGGGVMAGKQLSEVTLFCQEAATIQSGGILSGTACMAGDFSFNLLAEPANNVAQSDNGAAQIDYCGVHLENPAVLGATPVKVFLVVNPDDYSRGNGLFYLVAHTVDGYTATYAQPGRELVAGEFTQLHQVLSDGVGPEAVVDLSGNGPRANCYIASIPLQKYAFDATVAGNGFVTEGLRQAVQHFEGRALNTELAGGTARLLWQSSPNLLKEESVSYAAGRIRFTLSNRPTALGGSAVIGLFADEESEEALWSWHIWITDKDNAQLTASAQTYVLFAPYEQEYGSGAVQLMDRNLGAVAPGQGIYARNYQMPIYQWGRKDPMPWGEVVYDAEGNPQSFLSWSKPAPSTGMQGQYMGYTGNSAYATAHPVTFITTSPGTSYDWYYGGGRGTTPDVRNNELWGNPLGYQLGQRTQKTLFDPCPAGWKVPHPYAFSSFTKTGASAQANSMDANVVGSFTQGWDFRYNGIDATYYPGVGFRGDEFGFFAFAPSGYYWTSAPAPSDAFGAWVFGFTSAAVYMRLSDPRGFALPVRCMRDLPMP